MTPFRSEKRQADSDLCSGMLGVAGRETSSHGSAASCKSEEIASAHNQLSDQRTAISGSDEQNGARSSAGERPDHTRKVVGSNPTAPTTLPQEGRAR